MWRFFYDAADTVNADAWCRTAIMNRNRWKTQQRRLTRKSIWRGKKCCMPSSVSYIIRPLRKSIFRPMGFSQASNSLLLQRPQFGKPFHAQPGQKDYRMTTPFQIQYLTPSVAPLQDWATIVFVRQGELNLIDWLGSKLPDSSRPGQWLSLARYCAEFLIDWLGSKLSDSFVLDSYSVQPGTVCTVLDWLTWLKNSWLFCPRQLPSPARYCVQSSWLILWIKNCKILNL